MRRSSSVRGDRTASRLAAFVAFLLLVSCGESEPESVPGVPDTGASDDQGLVGPAADIDSTIGFDGTWRFTGGTVDGVPLKNPTSMGNFLTLDGGWATYTVSCNTAYAAVDIDAGRIEFGDATITAMGCGEYPPENDLFVAGIERAETIGLDGSDLIIAGTESDLRFARLRVADQLGELPLTAAGDILKVEIPDDRPRYEWYIITGSPTDPGGSALYLLTAASAESAASWQRWEGEPDAPATPTAGPGPDTIVIPDGIYDGGYGLCSPYWEPDQFCFTLRVRPPGSPWIVTAGPDGVVLHDANGTSSTVSAVAVRQAFYVDGTYVIEPVDGPDRLVVTEPSGTEREVPLGGGEVLLDAAIVGGRPVVLVSDTAETTRIDLETEERLVAGPGAIEGRFSGSTTLLRTTPQLVVAVDASGRPLWDRTVATDTMVAPDGQGRVRVDIFHTLQIDAGPDPYFQYIATELVDPATGETVETFEREVAIPEKGHAIAEPCLRTEIEEGLRLCPQSDGRILILDQYDESRVLTTGYFATFARLS